MAVLAVLALLAIAPAVAPAEPLPLAEPASGSGPQVLTSDLVQTQQVRADHIVVTWAIVSQAPLREVTINGEAQPIAPGDTAVITRSFALRVARTVITIVATDQDGRRTERSYLIVNPALPPRAGSAAPPPATP